MQTADNNTACHVIPGIYMLGIFSLILYYFKVAIALSFVALILKGYLITIYYTITF